MFDSFRPQGVLRVHVVEAKDLMKMDIGMLGKGKSDPYAIVTVGAQVFRTPIINNTVNPKWDYWCEVSPYSSSFGNESVFKRLIFVALRHHENELSKVGAVHMC